MNEGLQRPVNNLAFPGPGIKRFISVYHNSIRVQGRSFRGKVSECIGVPVNGFALLQRKLTKVIEESIALKKEFNAREN